MKFAIGDKAIEKKIIRPFNSYTVLKVVGYLDDSLLVSHYGDGFEGDIRDYGWVDEPGSRLWRSAITRYQESELFTPEEALAELKRLESDKNKLDKEFEEVRDNIQSKLNQAANYVQEAASIAKSFNRDFFQLKQECMKLYQALDAGGWSHSHMKC